MQRIHPITLAALATALVACTGSAADVDTTSEGVTRYRDATTDHDGNTATAARPQPQDMSVEIRVEGAGDLSGLDTQCAADDLGGSFEGLFSGEATIDDDGVYAAGLASGEAAFYSASGCTVPDVEITAVTEVVVRASLEASTSNCQSYCQASARAHGEATCGADAEAASCRTDAEAEYAASCTTTCTSSKNQIVAESRLSADAIAAMNSESITGAALGEIQVDLTFDHVEDADGTTVTESP